MARKVSEGCTLPDDIDPIFGVTDIPDALLRTFMGGPWKLHHEAVDQHAAFADAAKAVGIGVVPIPGAASAYRSLSQQVQLFHQRFSLGARPGTQKTYQGQVYTLNPHMANAATPGTSMHGAGLAVDYMRDNGRSLSWAENAQLRPVGAQFGIVSTVTSEAWHWACQHPALEIGGAIPPDWPDAPAVPAVEPPPVMGDGGTLLYTVNSSGPVVAWIQQVLHDRASQDVGKADGKFGSRTAAGVKNLQAVIHATDSTIRTDGVVDEQTFGVLRWISVANGGPDAPA